MRLLTQLAAIIDRGDVNLPTTQLGSDRSALETGLQIFFGIATAVAALIIAISAFRMVISRGNAQDVQKARDSIIYAAIGLAITMSAFVIVTFVVGRI